MLPQHHDMWHAIGSRHFDAPPLKTTLRTALPPPPPFDHDDERGAGNMQAHLRYIARRSTRVARETYEVIERSRSQMAEGSRRLARAEQVLVVAERRLEQTRTI